MSRPDFSRSIAILVCECSGPRARRGLTQLAASHGGREGRRYIHTSLPTLVKSRMAHICFIVTQNRDNVKVALADAYPQTN